MTIKDCTKCGASKPVTEFSRRKGSRDGYRSQCKACLNDGSRARRIANPEKIREGQRKWRARNHEKVTAYHRAWVEDNPGKSAEYNRRYRQKNPDKEKVRYLENKDRFREYKKQYYEKNKDKVIASVAKRRVLLDSVQGEISGSIIRQMINDQGFICAYCEEDLSDDYHVEHMVPLSRGGAHDWTNIAITCPTCNRAKYTKSVEEYMELLEKRKPKGGRKC